jgi:hypothetical protein
MWTGRQAFERIESAIVSLHRQENELDNALASATAEAERLRRERSDAFRELARIKLDEITANRLVEDLDAAEARAVRLLERQRSELDRAATERQAALTALEQAVAERSSAAATLEAAVDSVDELRAKVAEEIKSSEDWLRAKAAFDSARKIAEAADAKAAQSEEELAGKRKPYDEDPLFAYLWSIGYLTPRYRAGVFARFMDRITARHIGFVDARLNYAMLIQIPARLREHARLQQEIAESRKSALEAIERSALSAAGEDELVRRVEEARRKLAEADEAVERAQAALRAADEKRDALVANLEDEAYRDALHIIATADAQDRLGTLVQEAKRTATPADDAIVQRIGELNERIERIDAEIAELRKSARSIAERRLEVERARDRFRKSGYDHPDATFDNNLDLERILGQILGGAVTGSVLWDILRAGFGLRYPGGRRRSKGLTFPFPFPVPMPGRHGEARGDEWRRPDARGGWFPPDDAWGKSRPWGDDGGDDDDDDDGDHRRGKWETGGRF